MIQAPLANSGFVDDFPSRGGSSRGRAAVIGSGFGGLAAAIRLQAMGFETICYESRDRAGGRAYVYRDAGFTFDAGPTVITAPHCLEELFELAGESMSDHVAGGSWALSSAGKPADGRVQTSQFFRCTTTPQIFILKLGAGSNFHSNLVSVFF